MFSALNTNTGQPQAGSLDNGGGLTWQQTSMLQQATSVQPAKSRGRRTKSENQAEDFPMLGKTWLHATKDND